MDNEILRRGNALYERGGQWQKYMKDGDNEAKSIVVL
jgi:hypothetical protein